jgi:hypothetical protein
MGCSIATFDYRKVFSLDSSGTRVAAIFQDVFRSEVPKMPSLALLQRILKIFLWEQRVCMI